MSKRMLINYLLFVLIIVFTWIGIKYPIREDQMINRNAITTLKPKNINSIKIETADNTIQLTKNGQLWTLDSPVHWFANNIAAERLATLAAVEPQSKLPIKQIDLSTLGLRIPKAVVTLNNKSVFFGDTNRIGNRRYLMVEPNVYLATDIHYAFISQGVNGLIDERLLPSHLALSSLQFSNFRLDKTAKGWSSDAEGKSTEQLNQLITNWQRTPASRITAYQSKAIPLQKITATLEDGNKLEFFVLAIQPEIIIARPDLGLEYHFPDHEYYNLLSLDKPSE